MVLLFAAAIAALAVGSSGFGHSQRHGANFVPDQTLRLTYQNASLGCQQRPSVLVNGSVPAPTLRIKPGKQTWIRVFNDMDYNATIHWHGITQRSAIFSDGTPSASQWPIPPHHYFDYEVRPQKGDAGTYFYHSHVGFQASTAIGALIVEDDGPPPYKYDHERVVLFSDYFNETDTVIESGLVATPFVWSGETNAVLINGVGVSIGEQAGKGKCKLPVIHVEPGKTYRLRFIGATALSMTQFGIVDHDNFTIIAADGQYTKPHSESFMQVATGQRFDVLFTAKSRKELNGTKDFIMQFETKDRPTVYYGYGVLRYGKGKPSIKKGPAKPPLALPNSTYNWLEYALEPMKPNNFPQAHEVTRRLVIEARQVLTHTDIWRVGGDQWNESTIYDTPGDRPYLINIYENGPDAIPDYNRSIANGGWDPVTYTWPFKIGEVVEIIWQNTGSLVQNNGGVDYHPMHAHGGHYYDIGSGNGTYNATENEKKLAKYQPVLRDTTNLYRYTEVTTAGINAGWRGWRLRVEDAGVWMVHCHILQHMAMGFQSVWVLGNHKQITKIPHYDAAGYLQYGGSAFGNETFAPSYVHNFDD